jgi:hypothetical protein
MLISQLFRSSPNLNDDGFKLLQKWYRLNPKDKHKIIKEIADGLKDNRPGGAIKDKLKQDIDNAVHDAEIANLKY